MGVIAYSCKGLSDCDCLQLAGLEWLCLLIAGRALVAVIAYSCHGLSGCACLQLSGIEWL